MDGSGQASSAAPSDLGRRGIVDAHHHLLNVEALDYPWIRHRRAVLEALLDNYYDIARRYDVDQYRSDVGDGSLGASVACEFGAADSLAEAAWVQRCSDADGLPDAFIAGVDLTSPELDATLARYRDLPVVRALRQPLYWSEDPLRRLGARPDFLVDPAWWRGFERVATEGLTWDLLVYDEQVPAALPLIRAFPGTCFVLEAAGWPLDLGPDGFRRWEERLRSVADLPNVTLKLQGVALLFGPSKEAVEPWVRTAVDVFGPRRCMFASHFPVDRLLWSYEQLVATIEAVLGDLPAADTEACFSGCATRIYGLSPSSTGAGPGERRPAGSG